MTRCNGKVNRHASSAQVSHVWSVCCDVPFVGHSALDIPYRPS